MHLQLACYISASWPWSRHSVAAAAWSPQRPWPSRCRVISVCAHPWSEVTQLLLGPRLAVAGASAATVCRLVGSRGHGLVFCCRSAPLPETSQAVGDSTEYAVVSGLALGSGKYFAWVGVGTPPTPALLVLDTGSDVVWLQCAPCCRFYALSGRVFGQQDRCGTAPQQRRRCIALQQRRPASSHLARAASPSRTPAVATTSSPDLSLSTTTNSSTPSRSRCSFASTSSC